MNKPFVLPALLQDLHEKAYTNHTFETGSCLLKEGDTNNQVFIILSGKVVLKKRVRPGKELSLQVLSNNEIAGASLLFSDEKKQSLSAYALEKTEGAMVTTTDLEKALLKNGKAAIEYIKWLTKEQRKMETKLRDLLLYGKKGALYSTLIRLSNSYGVDTETGIALSIKLTNQDLASFCGTSREVINRLLKELKKKGVITNDKGIITINDLHYLKETIQCENCPKNICVI